MRSLAAFALIACSAPAAGPPTRVAGDPPARIAPQIAPTETAVVKEIDAVALPTDPLCKLAPEPWTGPLSLRRGGPPFATITSMTSALSLDADADGRFAVASIVSRVVTLRGATAAPPLFLKRPTGLGGFVIPYPTTAFVWEEAHGASDAVTISFDLTAFFIAPPLLKEEVRCENLGLLPVQYDPRALLAGEKLETVGVVGGDVELRLSPATPPVAKTAKGEQRMAVFVLEKGKDKSRVLLDIGTGYAFGWIDSNQINTNSMMGGGLAFARVGVAHRDVFSKQCERDLELIAEVGGERAVIGSLKAGAAFEPGAADATSQLTRVTPTLEWLRMERGASLWVRTTELAACRRRGAKGVPPAPG